MANSSTVAGIYLNKATNHVQRVSATPIAPGPEWTKVSDDPMLGIVAIRKLLADARIVAEPESVNWDFPPPAKPQ